MDLSVEPRHEPRLEQFTREGVRYTAQAFQQMRPSRRRVVLVATLRGMETTLTDAAIVMFGALIGRAHLRARKRLEQRVAASGREGRERLMRVASVLEAMTRAARSGADIAPLDTIDADAGIIRRSGAAHKGDVLEEITAEHHTFKRVGAAFLRAFDFQGGTRTAPLRQAKQILADLDGDGPLGHYRTALAPACPGEGRNRPHILGTSDLQCVRQRARVGECLGSAHPDASLARRAARRTTRCFPATGLLSRRSPCLAGGTVRPARPCAARGRRQSGGRDPALFAGDRLRFPKEKDAKDHDDARSLALACYGMVPTTRITDVLSQVSRWTGFVEHFGHVSTGLPPTNERVFLATLIAEATSLGLSRMAEVCGAASRRALLRMQTWHMREETFGAALACLTDAIHAEPLAAWFGPGHRASADGQGRPTISAVPEKRAEP